MILINLRVVIS